MAKSATMIEKKLSDISSERYFLLSEIEQKSNFWFRIEDASRKNITQLSEDHVLFIIYSIWEAGQPYEKLLEKLLPILTQAKLLQNDEFYGIVVVDILLSHRSQYTSEFVHDISKALLYIKAKLYEEVFQVSSSTHNEHIHCEIVFAFADHIAAAPGLEQCFEYLEILQPGYKYDFKPMTFLGEDVQEMNCRNIYQEPDAQSNVFQVVCQFENGVEAILEKAKVSAESKRGLWELKHAKKSDFKTVGLLLAVLIAVVAVLIVAIHLINKPL